MKLSVVGCNHRTAPVAIRERLAIPAERVPALLTELLVRFGGEAAVLSTCNRLELYLAENDADPSSIAAFLGEWNSLDASAISNVMYHRQEAEGVRHLFRVVSGLDSLVLGEGQIAGQVKQAYELANTQAAVGPLLHALFQTARQTAKRVRRETDLAAGHASISSVAVDFIRQVFDHFDDKTVLVIGAGKMGRLTLTHLNSLGIGRIIAVNRNHEKAVELAAQCGGVAQPWDQLDHALIHADIVLSTTGAPEPIVTARRFAPLLARRSGAPLVVIDIAVPRDFDAAIHDGDRVCLFNIDDLQRVRQRTLTERQRHIAPAETIVEQEASRFVAEWARRRTGPTIARLTAEFDVRRRIVLEQLMQRLNGRLTDDDKKSIEGAFRLLQNQFLHGPISVLGEESRTGGGTLLEALRQLFRLRE